MSDHLSAVFAALADPTRRGIIARLCESDATVGELAEPFNISAPAISRHLKVLERANLIERNTEAQFRRCRVKQESLQAATDWLEEQRIFWQTSFTRLDNLLKQADEP